MLHHPPIKQLHILNGDALLPAFRLAALFGDVLVWREILSEGPVSVSSEASFWEARQQYICSTYPETEAAYKQKVLDELLLLEKAEAYDEVVLWFDTDLMCQVNLLFLVQYLARRQAREISLATPSQKPVAYLLPGELQFVYDKRKVLPADALQQAAQLWQAYASPDPTRLQQKLHEPTTAFPYLNQALQKHLQRFPSCHTGLSQPEQTLLELLATGMTDVQELMQNFWQKEPLYGYGDWQLLALLDGLAPELVQRDEHQVQLTELGKEVLQQKRKRQTVKPFDCWVGGVQLHGSQAAWCRDRHEKLVRQG